MAFKMKAGKEGPMKKNFGSAMNFNAGLRAASKAGKLDNNPKFKAAVDKAPTKAMKNDAPMMRMEKGAMKKMGSPKMKMHSPMKTDRGRKAAEERKKAKFGEKGYKEPFKDADKFLSDDEMKKFEPDYSKKASPKKIDLNFKPRKGAKEERRREAKRDFLANWKTLSDEQKRKVPTAVTKIYGVTKPANPAKGQLGGLKENAQK